MNDNHDDKQKQALGLLAAGMGALLELLSECRTCITEEWDPEHPETIALVEKIDVFLGPVAGKTT
jgi:hypothetical protein